MKIDIDKRIKDGVEQAMKECELTIGMTLKEAVEKQIPKKPFIYKCPKCQSDNISVMQDGGYFETRFDYCPDCGQALDWSDSNDKL